MAFGSGAMTNSISEIGETDFILALGTNTTETHPVLALQIFKALKNGSTLAVGDPRKTEIAIAAHYHLRYMPGFDLAILNALAYTILEEDLYNKEFIENRTEGFGEYKNSLVPYAPEEIQKLTGVSAQLIRETARAYAKASKAMILYTMGITQHVTGTDNVLAIANLAMLTGHIGSLGNGVCPLRGQNNVQGACDMGALPDVLPGYQRVDNEEKRQRFEKAWGIELPITPGLTIGEIFDAAHAEKLKVIYIIGENPLVSDPDTNHVKEALAKAEFLVVQDLFLSETAKVADVVFPAASFAEKTGTVTNTERRVQMVNKAIEPVGESKTDGEIICALSSKMGYPMLSTPDQVFAEAAALTPQYAGMSHERLLKNGLQWPCPDVSHPGTPILHGSAFTRGKGKFHIVNFLPPDESTDEDYPFIMTTGRRLYHYHTGTMTRRSKALAEICPQEYLEINPQDAGNLNVVDGDKVKVKSRRGEMVIALRITERVCPGLVFASFHFYETLVNAVTNSARDEKSKISELKVSAISIKKI